MKQILSTLALFASLALGAVAADAPKPIRALLVLGGCCHDYEKQKTIISEGVAKRANVVFTIEHNPDKGTKPLFEVYKKADWAKDFDVVVHDECAADVTDKAYVQNILAAHLNGTPAVNLHCAMHSYRWGNYRTAVKAGDDNAGWFEYLGLQSTSHGPQEPIAITYVEKNHPITKPLADWTTEKEELYNNIQVMPSVQVLAKGKQDILDKKTNETKSVEAVVAWTNLYGPKKTRVFSTTIGHNNTTVGDDRYLNLVTNGILWAAGKLGEDGKPLPGYGK